MEGAPLDDSVVDRGDDSIRSTNNGGVSKAVDCDEIPSKSNNSIPTANKPQQQPRKKQYRTLHEHLHTELTQLISVKPPLPSSSSGHSSSLDTSDRRKQTSLRPVLLDKYTPSQLVHKSKNEDRRLNKVEVVERFIEVLKDDQTGSSSATSAISGTGGGLAVGSSSGDEIVTEVNGPIHGCVSTHWKLLPPIYKPPPSNLPKVYKPDDGGNKAATIQKTDNTQSDASFKDNQDSQDLDQDRKDDNKEEEEILIKGGGIKLPGLDWNKTFRKGYSILVWVRPSLANSLEQQSQNESSAIGGESEIGTTKNKEGKRKPQKQILYRFATSSNDNTSNSVGVCAMLGQWTAVPLSSKEDGESSRRMLTTTVTAYTLPNSDPMGQLYPDDNETNRQHPPSTAEKAAQGTELGLTEEVETKEQQRKERKKNRSAKKDKAPTIGLVTPGNSSRQLEQVSQLASTTTPRLVGKLKKSSLRKGGGSPRSRTKSNDAPPFSNQKNNNNNGYISSTLTLPENEWTLLSIQHTHPYLRRPELSIQVNGMTVFKDEIGYPILDAVIFPSNDQDDDNYGGGGLGIHPSWSGDALESPQKKGNRGRSSTSDMDENVQLRRRGILADCTLLNGAFDNGVQVLDSSSSRRKKTTTIQSCTTSVHSLAILPGPPLPNAVLAMIAERGPISDVPSCSGLSFVLGPVPTNPQNRDGIVALNAGHGFYGSAPDNSNGGGGTPRSPGRGGIMGGGGYPGSRSGGGGGVNDLAPPRSLGIPVSIGITPGVYPAAENNQGNSDQHGSSELESWIGRQGEEHAAHVCLQGLLGRVAWTFHSADSKILGGVGPSINGGGEGDESDYSHRERIVCQPSTGPSRIGGADAVPKVGIVRPTPPSHVLSSTGMEVTGNASSHNVTWNYIQQEMERDSSIQIRPSSSTNSKGGGYNLDDNPPISFSRAMQGANTMNLCTLPFRLALPHAGTEEVNDTQRTIHVESFAHLNDLLCNDGELAASLISLVAECIRCGGSAIRDEALQNGVIHALASLIRKVLIRGSRLGILSSRGNGRPTEKSLLENYDYDKDHDSSCPPIVPSSIADAIVSLVDACCGPSYNRVDDQSSRIQCNPSRGILRIRRASDLALTAVFGLALDFDLLGNDPMAAAPILKAVASRYCQADTVSPFNGEDYGSLLRKQVNLQYFLDCIRIRFDHSVESSPPSNGGRGIRRPSLVTPHRVSAATNDRLIESVASSLSDILYTMLLSTLTSAAGISVSRGERDVGALVATLTECPLGSLCAHVVTTSIARLLVKCGVMSSLCLGASSTTSSQSHNRRRSTSTTTPGRIREPEDIALESRLGRNMLLCHYHDIVAPLLLSRSTPRSSPQLQGDEPEDDEKKSDGQELSSSVDFTNNKGTSEVCHPLDWSHHWRLSLLTFTVSSSQKGSFLSFIYLLTSYVLIPKLISG